MDLAHLVQAARESGASDLHLESGMPPTARVSSSLQAVGEPLSREVVTALALEVVGEEFWPELQQRGSFDASRTIAGVRCRINVLQTSRGVGLAIRLLSSFQATLERLNLHPDLRKFCTVAHGLVLVSGPTGSGKSSTMAALIQEINQTRSQHIITIEQPVEYQFTPVRSFIRQREVGRDTPSFEQALIDAMREDPDVLMVGEMREPETMRLTLNASETGHLVLATIHSSSAAEALQRIISAFPSEIQNSIAAQLADTLAGVICQRLRFHNEAGIPVPECEILHPTHAVKNFIRRAANFTRYPPPWKRARIMACGPSPATAPGSPRNAIGMRPLARAAAWSSSLLRRCRGGRLQCLLQRNHPLPRHRPPKSRFPPEKQTRARALKSSRRKGSERFCGDNSRPIARARGRYFLFPATQEISIAD